MDCAEPSMNFSRLTFFHPQNIITAFLSCLDTFSTWNNILKLCCNVVCTGCSHVLNNVFMHKFLPAYLQSQSCSYTIYTAKLSVVTWFQIYVPHKICCLFIMCHYYMHALYPQNTAKLCGHLAWHVIK